jgi:hypothetical protein
LTFSNGNKIVSAFQWKEYMAIERANEPKKKVPPSVSQSREKRKNDSFGTIPWLAKKQEMLKPKEFLIYSKAGIK